MSHLYIRFVPVLAAALFLGACASTGEHESTETPTQVPGTTEQPSTPYSDNVVEGSTVLGGEASSSFDAAVASERGLSTNVVYFAYDDSSIAPEYQSVIEQYAKYLSANPSAKLRLEGHADERGTREYNVGLGERRANAVQAALTAQGASDAQLSIISYGEERPADVGHDEAAWSKNRRVQLIRQ